MVARAFLAAILGAVLFSAPAYAAGAEVRVRATSYAPPAVQIQAGESVVWRWEASLHTVTAVDGSFDSDRECGTAVRDCRAAGNVFTHTFSKPGLYAYRCKVQPVMVGRVEVVEAKAQEPPPPPPAGGSSGQAPPAKGQPEGSRAQPGQPAPQVPPPQPAPPPRRRMAAVPGLSYANAPPAEEAAPDPIPPAVAPRRDPLSVLPEGGPPPVMPEEPEEPPAQLALEVPARPEGPPTGLVVGIAIASLLVTAGAFGKFVLFRPPWS